MGFALAVEAVRRGAEVLLIHGPVNLPLPPGVRTVAVKTAEEMMAAVKSEYPHYHIVLMAAAVADFKPLIKSADKIKKREHLTLELVKTPDILQWMGENRTKQYLVGFSLESEENIAEARRKLIEKRANLLILNSIEAMEADENRVILISEQSEERPPLMSKQMVAKFIFNRIISEIK
jgi:phosphopantothenoylcysteine decarboxylase/phosphopantothenate--cysteine ligase